MRNWLPVATAQRPMVAVRVPRVAESAMIADRASSIEAAQWTASRRKSTRPCSMPLGSTRTDAGAAQAGQRNHTGAGGRLWLDELSIRSVLVQRIVDPTFFVIADVITDQAAKVLLVQCNDVIQDLAAAAPKVTVGMVKKSNATMASRWFRRNASHFLHGSPRR